MMGLSVAGKEGAACSLPRRKCAWGLEERLEVRSEGAGVG